MSLKNVAGALLATAAGLAIPSGVSAGEIALTLKAQDITLIGDFGGFQGESYVLITSNGTIFVPATLVTCEGEDCLEFTVATNNS